MVRLWKDDRGFGFIEPAGGYPDVFIHANALRSNRRPSVGDIVTFEVEVDDKGRNRAVDVLFLNKDGSEDETVKVKAWPILVAAAYLLSIALLAYRERLPVLAVPYVLILSLMTITVYWWDKEAAKRQAWRVPEKSLHFWDLLGGWPGGLIAQQTFRHKRRKADYQAVFWLTVLANIMVMALIGFIGT